MQGDPAEPSSAPDDKDPSEVSLQLSRQVARLKRWYAWNRWMLEPRSFAPPEDEPDDDGRPRAD